MPSLLDRIRERRARAGGLDPGAALTDDLLPDDDRPRSPLLERIRRRRQARPDPALATDDVAASPSLLDRILARPSVQLGLKTISPIPFLERQGRQVATEVEGVERPTQPLAGIFDLPAAVRAVPDVVRGLVRHPVATVRGGVAGAVEGTATVPTPLDAITFGMAGISRAAQTVRGVRPAVQQGGRVVQGVRAAAGPEEAAQIAQQATRRVRLQQAVTQPPGRRVVRGRRARLEQVSRRETLVDRIERRRLARTGAVPPTPAGIPPAAGPQMLRPLPPTGARAAIGARTVPPAQPIPAQKLLEFPSIQKMPEEIRGDLTDILTAHQGFAAQRRGVQSVARTEALADRLDVPLELLKPGQALNAEELASYKNAIASILMKRQPLMKAIQEGAATDVDKLRFSQLTDQATVLTASYRGAKAETGRALNVLRSKARVLEFGDEGFINAAIKAPGFQDDIARVAKAATEAAGDPVKQLDMLKRAALGTAFDKASSVFYNSLLSGVKTHLRNTIGNSFNAIANTITPLGAAPADIVRSRLTGQPRTVFLGEIKQNILGSFAGLEDGFKDAIFTLRHGFTPEAVGRASAGRFDRPIFELPGGLLTNFPSRGLQAMDVFFRSIAYKQELFAGAYAAARRAGLTRPRAISQHMSELLTGNSRASQTIRAQAKTFEARAVFQEEPGPVVRLLLKGKGPDMPLPVRALVTWQAPFMRTPSAILRQGAEFSPLGFGMRATRQGGRPGAQALGRASLGTAALLGPLAWLAGTGRLTGAPPSSPGERAAFFESGKRPNSVKIGNRWVSYQLFQPLSVPMAAVANAYQRFKESDQSAEAAQESAVAAVTGVGASLLDQSFLSGLGTTLDAVQDPERNAQRFLTLAAQGFVPGSGLLRNITQAVDPVIRRPQGVAESMKAIIPGLSRTVPPRRTRFGEPATRPGGPIQRGFIVPTISREQADPVSAALERLDITPGLPQAHLVTAGERVPLTRDQSQAIQEAIGRERRGRLERVIGFAAFPRMSEDRQRQLVEDALRDASTFVLGQARARIRRGTSFTTKDLMSVVVRGITRRRQIQEGQ